MDSLSHVDSDGNAQMVDVSGKPKTKRRAVAEGFIRMSEEHIAGLRSMPKGDALVVAQIAAIQAAKKTSDLIPLCHPLSLTNISVKLIQESGGVRITAEVSTNAETGVEMEALTAVSVGALTVYDMVKALGQDLEISGIRLLEKSGGKTDWKRD
jgi:cyclic pyranopterin phosphate synthase